MVNALDESQRLLALRGLAILDTPPEESFDELTRLLASVCEVPIALVSLVDAERQWFKSKVGLEATETARNISFCTHAIERSELFVVEDALEDPRFRDNPLVRGAPEIRFYAGAPLVTAEGAALGTVCVIDRVPRKLTARQEQALRVIGHQVLRQLEMRRLAREARINEQRWRLALAGAGDGVWEWDLQRDEVRLLLQRRDGSGDHEQVLRGEDWRARVHPEDALAFRAALDAHVNGHTQSYANEHRVRRSDGSFAWVLVRGTVTQRDEAGKPLWVLGTYSNIDDRKKDELRLRESEERHRMLVASLREGILLRSATGEITSCNASAERILGASAEELIGQKSLSPRGRVVRENGEPVPVEALPAIVALKSGKPQLDTIVGVHRPDGRVVWVSINALPISASDGKPFAVVSSFYDITERRHLEDRLSLSERLASLGRLAAGVAHEINNPLTFVLGNLAVMEQRIVGISSANNREQREREALSALEDALVGAQRVRDVVKDLKSLSRPEEGNAQAVELGPLLESCIGIAMHELRHRARVVRDYGDVPKVLGRETRLGQVFVNLLVNAAHAIPVGDVDQHRVTISTRTDGAGKVVVRIEDTGFGIATELLPRIFDPFFTTKQQGAGSGLGLPICHRIITMHGGSIEVQSELGRGTTVSVTLPAAPELGLEATGIMHALPEPAHKPELKILVIDDEPAVGRIVRRFLSPKHEIVWEEDAEVGLQRIKAGELFDVILCDIVMPRLSGDGFFHRLSEVAPDQVNRVLFMTGGAQDSPAHRFLGTIPNGRIEKPFSSKRLEEELLRCAERASVAH